MIGPTPEKGEMKGDKDEPTKDDTNQLSARGGDMKDDANEPTTQKNANEPPTADDANEPRTKDEEAKRGTPDLKIELSRGWLASPSPAARPP